LDLKHWLYGCWLLYFFMIERKEKDTSDCCCTHQDVERKAAASEGPDAFRRMRLDGGFCGAYSGVPESRPKVQRGIEDGADRSSLR
jgi:hypothetical protein